MDVQRDWIEKDYYRTLGVSSTATHKEITKAYRMLARKLHPDANPDDAKAEDRFKEVSAAYDVVGDEDKRKKYDEVRALGPAAFGPGGAPGGAGGFGFDGDIGDILGGLFGGRMRGGPMAGGGRGPQRGRDQEASLHLAFEDAVHGITTTLSLSADASCSTCAGTGARPGSSSSTCATCEGRGVVAQNQGPFSFSQPCPSCGGMGTVIADPCPTCRGTGAEHRTREVRVRIPPGVRDGQRIRLRGQGAPGRNGGPAGDLYVLTSVARDARFGRSGDDLTINVPISYPDAVLGATIEVPTLDDGSVKLKVPPGSTSGRTLRVKGRGVRVGSKVGNLLVTIQIEVPTELSDDQLAAVEALAATLRPTAGEGTEVP